MASGTNGRCREKASGKWLDNALKYVICQLITCHLQNITAYSPETPFTSACSNVALLLILSGVDQHARAQDGCDVYFEMTNKQHASTGKGMQEFVQRPWRGRERMGMYVYSIFQYPMFLDASPFPCGSWPENNCLILLDCCDLEAQPTTCSQNGLLACVGFLSFTTWARALDTVAKPSLEMGEI